MKVCVQGLWHLGSVVAGCIASLGHEVIGFDSDCKIIQELQKGNPLIYEPGLSALLKAGIASRRLWFTARMEDLPRDIEILWVTYDTPINEEDEADVDFVIDNMTKIMTYLPDGTTVLVSSQLPVGSVSRLERLASAICTNKRFSFACSPENLRLGEAIDAFLNPDRIIVGVRNKRDRECISQLLKPITDKVEWMRIESAEMTKHSINAFLAASIAFANEIATVCELVGADAKEVERGMKSENRIGPRAYLAPGGAFAGGTLARDIEYLKGVSRSHKFSMPLIESVKTSNDQHKNWVSRRLKDFFPTLNSLSIAILGLTYKSGTDTLRRSLSVEICNWLIKQNARISVHDPVVKDLPEEWNGKVQSYDSVEETIRGVQALVIGTEWPVYKEIRGADVVELAPGVTVLDPNRFLTSFERVSGIKYISVGMPSAERVNNAIIT
jgi:UDPglucose 6-dehydrogenase